MTLEHLALFLYGLADPDAEIRITHGKNKIPTGKELERWLAVAKEAVKELQVGQPFTQEELERAAAYLAEADEIEAGLPVIPSQPIYFEKRELNYIKCEFCGLPKAMHDSPDFCPPGMEEAGGRR